MFVRILQGVSELVAKDDNTEAGESNQDKKNEDKDNPMDNEDDREKIHEQVDEVSARLCGICSFTVLMPRCKCMVLMRVNKCVCVCACVA